MNAGTLIVFEGIDGSGKSTQLRRIAERLRAGGHDVVVTREPTDGEWGQRIRAMARSGETVPPEDELAWFVADRRDHVAQVLAPALAAGQVVVCDRYFLSSAAYQGARGLDMEAILAESEAEFPLPDLVVVVEVSARRGLARAARRSAERGAIAEPAFENRAFLEAVAANFAKLDRPYVARVDGSGSEAEVERAILDVLRERLSLP